MLDHPNKASSYKLDTLIGHLKHCGFIIPHACHFLGRICTAKHRASKCCHIQLSLDVQTDLLLWLSFLSSASKGINMNNLAFQNPTHVSPVDACKHGIGGYSLITGQSWCFEIPSHLKL
jgi:hypothetical protein